MRKSVRQCIKWFHVYNKSGEAKTKHMPNNNIHAEFGIGIRQFSLYTNIYLCSLRHYSKRKRRHDHHDAKFNLECQTNKQ